MNSAQFTKVFFLSSAMVAFSWEGGCSGKEEGRDCISQWSPSLSTSLTHEFHHKRQTWPSIQPALSRNVTTSCNAVGSAVTEKTEIIKNRHGTSSRFIECSYTNNCKGQPVDNFELQAAS